MGGGLGEEGSMGGDLGGEGPVGAARGTKVLWERPLRGWDGLGFAGGLGGGGSAAASRLPGPIPALYCGAR